MSSQLTKEIALSDTPTTAVRAPATEPYDPEPGRERLRGAIASGLLGLLALVVLFSFALFLWTSRASADGKDFVAIILPSITGLVSAVVGFYYGSSKG